MALVDDVRSALRIKSQSMDTEINDLIAACKLDLTTGGVVKTLETDPLIKRAIIIYCKANFGMGNPESERLTQCYEQLKTQLALSGLYNQVVV